MEEPAQNLMQNEETRARANASMMLHATKSLSINTLRKNLDMGRMPITRRKTHKRNYGNANNIKGKEKGNLVIWYIIVTMENN